MIAVGSYDFQTDYRHILFQSYGTIWLLICACLWLHVSQTKLVLIFHSVQYRGRLPVGFSIAVHNNIIYHPVSTTLPVQDT